ncbi:MAG TPA: DUF932 domain-containing protein, partial [Chloroflexota bacterium]|nr:DUF932 domain-containing protein [Chloroflexota bacterium]
AVAEGATRRLGTRKLEEVVEVVGKKHGLNETEEDGILRHLIDGGDLTQWGLANAITAYSQAVPSYERATELEKVGGNVMTLDESQWKEVAN